MTENQVTPQAAVSVLPNYGLQDIISMRTCQDTLHFQPSATWYQMLYVINEQIMWLNRTFCRKPWVEHFAGKQACYVS